MYTCTMYGILCLISVCVIVVKADSENGRDAEETQTFSYLNKDCPAPAPCVCIGRLIDCSHKHLKQIPVFDTSVSLPASTRYVELRLNHNEIEEINSTAFYGLDLERLYLSYNRISRIGERAFDGLTNLKWLDVAENRISSLHAKTLHNLINLEDLVLSGNYLRSLNESFFARLDKLRVLILMDNELDVFPTGIKYLPNLSHLYLQRNNIQDIPDYAFANLKNLALINLSKMRTNLTLSNRAFCGHQQKPKSDSNQEEDMSSSKGISFVYLSNSGIRSIGICQLAFIPSINELDLEGNPMECDCDLFFYGQMKQNLKNVKCAKPDKYKDKSLSVDEVDDFSCTWNTEEIFTKCTEICDVTAAASVQIIRTDTKRQFSNGSQNKSLNIIFMMITFLILMLNY